MRLTLIQVPYDSGHCGLRMGRGPLHLIEQGLAGRDVEAPPELEVIESTGITRVRVEELDRLDSALADLATRVDQAYVHMDLDVLDPSELRANACAVPGGMTVDQMAEVVRATGRHLKIAAAGITAYDPDQDPEGRGVRVAERLLEALAG